MAELVIDIETLRDESRLDEEDLDYLLSPADREPTPDEQEARRAKIREQFSLNPFTGQVVCIGMLNPVSSQGRVLFQGEDPQEGDPSPDPGISYLPQATESELLEAFWGWIPKYRRIITFNGREFDLPFLYLRSLQLGVPVTSVNLLDYRFKATPHCDLADQLTFHQTRWSSSGARRLFNLDFYCKRFGIPSPKAGGISGGDVARMWEEGQRMEVARYCLRDVQATGQLYLFWKERFLEPSSR